MRAIVTRPADSVGVWCERLVGQGVDAVALPLVEIAPAAEPAHVRDAWRHLAEYRAVVFVSPSAVHAFFAARPPRCRWPAHTLAAGPGPGTAAALRAWGVPPESVIEPAADSASFDSESLWQAMLPRIEVDRLAGTCWLVVRGEGGRDWLAERLAERGAIVDKVAAYRRRAPRLEDEQQALLDSALDLPCRHVWLFSSSEAVSHLMQLAGPGRLVRARAIASHPRIAQTAREAGFAEVSQVTPRLDEWVAAILSLHP